MEPNNTLPNQTQYLDGNRYHLPNDGNLSNEKIVKDTLQTQTAWNIDRYASSLSLMAGYGDGFPLNVTYFKLETRPGYKSAPIDIVLSGTEHPTHKNLIKILNFEIRLSGPLDFQYDKDETFMTAVGQMTTPAGFKPSIGDMFYMLQQDGKWGIMAVRDIERLSLSQNTFHKCDIELVTFLTADQRDFVDACIVNTYYFDKQKYHINNMTLLTETSYIQMNTIKQLRKEMISYYYDKFMEFTINSVVLPSGVYDPYVVEFLHKKISVMDFPNRPQQLLPELNDYNDSIWACFTNVNQSNNPKTVMRSIHLKRRSNNYWQAGITLLLERDYIALGMASTDWRKEEQEVKEPYIFNVHFYNGNLVDMNAPEKLVFETLSQQVNIERIIEFANTYRTWDINFAFYWIPISIWLMDKAYFNVTQ